MTNGAPSFKLCGCLMDAAPEEFPAILSDGEVDVVEWRLDSLIRNRGREAVFEPFSHLPSPSSTLMLATCRHSRDGGFFEASDEERLDILARAATAGFHWIDLEERLDDDVVRRFQAMGRRILMSHHDFTQTPPFAALCGRMERMARLNPDAIKIVTLAHSPDDCLRVLELIPFGRRQWNLDVIAFCMGPWGRWTRAVSLILGSPWTYVRLAGQGEAASGQYTAREMRTLMRLLSDFQS